jgi:hypothetical protein
MTCIHVPSTSRVFSENGKLALSEDQRNYLPYAAKKYKFKTESFRGISKGEHAVVYSRYVTDI